MPSDIRISRMLRQVDAELAAAQGVFEATTAGATSVDVVQGLKVTLGTFPEVMVGAGAVLTPTGAAYTYEASTLEVDTESQGDSTAFVFINFDYAIELADNLPVDARYVLARVTLDEAGTGFDPVKVYGTSVVHEVNDNDDVIVTGLYTGPVCIERTDYVYDAAGQPLSTIQQSTYKSFQLDYVVNGSGEITDRKETHFPRQQFWLNGGVVLDDSEVLDGSPVSTQIFFPHRYLVGDGSLFADGSEFATGEY